MLNKAWKPLHQYFLALDKIYASLASEEFSASLAPIVSPNIDSETLAEIEQATQEQQLLEVTDYFNDVQTKLIDNLELCRENLAPLVTKRELDYVIAALTIHCDETLLTTILNRIFSKLECHCESKLHTPLFRVKSQWPSLQRSQLQCRDGGELFYEQLNELLSQSASYALAIEVHYFCLKQGFLGQYVNAPHEVDRLLDKLAKAITKNHSAYIAPQAIDALTENDERFGQNTKKEPKIGGDHAITP